ncbi:MAG: hypothetical protein ACP5PZ_08505 [Bacteroidales bacterium]
MTAILSSCEKPDDYSRLSYNYRYQANFAFAIGSSCQNLTSSGINVPQGWEQTPSLLAIPDTLILEDNLPFDPQAWTNRANEKIAQIILKIRGYNEFPDRAQLTFSLTDSLDISVFPEDSLATIIIPEAIFTNDTLPSQRGNFETYVTLTDRQLQNIINKRHLHIRTTIGNKTKHTEQYSYYRYLEIEVGVGVQVLFDFNLQTLKQ